MLELYDQIEEAADAIRKAWPHTPHAGIILGTGLGHLVEQVDVAAALDYESIPHFPKSTAVGHRGRLVMGTLEGVPVLAMEGRFHQYEGYPLKKITLPVRVMKRLGAKLLIVSQAVGGMNPYYRPGDVMIIDDHINLMGDNPLVGVNDDRLGPRFPDMSRPYDFELIEKGLEIARQQNFVAHRGVTVAVTGPNLETRAEYRFLRAIGADVVGMSTVPEAIVAVHCGLRTFGLSVVTDICFPDALEVANVEQIIATANSAEPRLRALVCGVLKYDAAKKGRAMLHVADQIDELVSFIRRRWPGKPRAGIILGSGLGSVGDAIEVEDAIDYGDLPHFLRSTAVGHRGRLLCGRLAGVPVVAMQGRFHCYEGYSAQRATFPVRVMKALGVELLVVSNAAGGLNPTYAAGDVMVIDDHINLLNRNPLIGVNDDRLGPRFPDMSAPYDRRLGDRALAIARHQDFVCHRGVYIAMLGPTYETRAEIRMLRYLGGDAVGMSTVPEAIVAAQAGMRVLGLSTITNVCSPDVPHLTSGDEVVATAETARDKLRAIVTGIVASEFGNAQI